MIDNSYGIYRLICCICKGVADEPFTEFNDAVEYKKQNGWKSQRRNGEWEDVCPECQEVE